MMVFAIGFIVGFAVCALILISTTNMDPKP